MRKTTPLLAVLATTVLAAPAAAGAADIPQPVQVSFGPIPQYVAPLPVANDDVSFTLTPNTTQTFRTPIAQLGQDLSVLVPCWGFDLTGPDVDVSAGALPTYGVQPDYPGASEDPHREGKTQDADGDWALPDPAPGLTPYELAQGADCKAINWSFYVDPASSATARAAAKKARKTKRPVRVKIKHTKKARKASINDAAAQVTFAGLHAYRDAGGVLRDELLITVKTGDLSGPTTLATHARVLLQK